MKEALLLSFKQAETITVKALQSKLQARKPSVQPLINQQKHSKGASNLTIISPFYERLNHKPNCTCKYHKKAQRVIVPKRRMQTEPNHGQLPNAVNKKEEGSEMKLDISGMQDLFDKWKNTLSTDEIKKIYLEYLKSIGNFDKVKRLDKLDCHNEAFEEFLRNNYLVILERRTKKEEKIKEKENFMKEKQQQKQKQGIKSKSSKGLIHKVLTQGNICFDSHSQFNFRNQVSVRNGSFRRSEFDISRDEPLSKSTIKFKKLGIKGTAKNLQLINQQQTRARREDPRRKKTKFINSRPSFFGLIQDQQLLRQLCMKLMNENKRTNRQAEHIVRHLIQSDIDTYQKMIQDIQSDLQSGIKLRNLNDEEANLLIKIVLNKIHRQAKANDSRDLHYDHKNSLIEELCNKYGWPKQDKIVQLVDFWKMRQQKGNPSNFYSRKSFGHHRESKSSLSRNNLYDIKQSKKSKSKVTIKDQQHPIGFYIPKSQLRLSKMNQTSTKTFIQEKSIDEVIQSNIENDFKINEKKTCIKAGVFGKSRKEKKLNSNFFTQGDSRMYNSKKNYGIFNRSKFAGRSPLQTLQESEDVINQLDQLSQLPDSSSRNGAHPQQRPSAFFKHKDNLVQRHIEVNKRFLNRIEHDLIDNQCEKLIIGMGESIITKKRKIRAIHQALETEELKNSEYYHDILRYLEIYEDYCNLVLMSRKEKGVMEKTTVNNVFIGSQNQQKEQEETSLGMLLDDLKKQRELKFISLNLLKQKQNPKEELILKIPQYTTKMHCKSKKKRKTTIESFGNSESESDQSIHAKEQNTILQKQLQDTVSLIIHKDRQNRQVNELLSEKEEIDDTFRKKIQHYRKIFKLDPPRF